MSDWEETRGSEFNAQGAFLTQLNAGADEVVAGVRFMTIRSDNNDKYAQPDGRFLGKPGRPTGVGYDGPELKGAENVVIPKIDHRETAFGPLAFGEMYRFITGRAPARVDIAPAFPALLLAELPRARARGHRTRVRGGAERQGERHAGGGADQSSCRGRQGGNLRSLAGNRRARGGGSARQVHRRGWAMGTVSRETKRLLRQVPRHAITHIYRSPFPRSSDIVHLRPASLAKGEETAGSVVTINRPRGYFGHGRATFLLDGKVPPGINEGVPGASSGKLLLPAGPLRPVPARFNEETITLQNWPANENHIVFGEFHY